MDISFKQDVMQRIHTIEIKKILIIQESVQGLNLMMIKTDILHYKIIFILYLNMEKMDLIKMPRSIFQQV
jgi:hypothetical protein